MRLDWKDDHLGSVLGPEMDPGARLATGEFCGEPGRGDTIPVVLGCTRPADREVVPPPAPSMHRVLMGQARRRLPADAWREVSRFVLLPPGWLCVKTRYGNQGRTYTRFSSQDGRHRHLRSVRAVVRQVARDNGEDPEAAVAKVCLESEVMGNLDILLNWCLFSRTVSLLGWKP